MAEHIQDTTPASGDLTGTYPAPTLISVTTAATVGSTTEIPIITYDNNGRIISTTTATISSPLPATATSEGVIQLDGDLGGTASLPEVVSTHLATPLPISQGGTGSTTQNFVDLTSNQDVSGLKTFTDFIDKGSEKYNVLAYGATGNGTTNDQVAIQNAINAAQAAGGGSVWLPNGIFTTSSSSRSDSVSYSTGNIFNDTSIVASDVGSYLLWSNQGRISQITAVTVGVSFTVDVLPTTLSATTALIVKPSLVLAEGVNLIGNGADFNAQTTAGNSVNNNRTKIQDDGTGVTILIRGANDNTCDSSRYGLSNLTVVGNAANKYGLFVGNGAWFIESENLDLIGHGIAGLALDNNINSHSFRNLNCSDNGSSTATIASGGIVSHPYSSGSSAALNIYNGFFETNYGFGVCDGDPTGASGIVLWDCQFNATQKSAMANSGTSMVLQTHGDINAMSAVYGGWTETAAYIDIITNGEVLVSGMQFYSNSGGYHWLVNGGTASAIGCYFGMASYSVSLANNGNINWNGCFCEDGYFYAGSPANVAIFGIGSSRYGSSTAGNVLTANANGEGSWQPAPTFNPVHTNYAPNPSFEGSNPYLAFTNYGVYGTITADNTTAYSGNTSSNQTNTASDDGGIICTGISLPAGTYNFSVYAKIQSTVTNASMVIRYLGGNPIVQINQAYPNNTNWNRYGGSFTLTAPSVVEILLGLGSYGGHSLGTVNYDAIMIEDSVDATTYFDGSTLSAYYNCTWNGAANDSSSTRVLGSNLGGGHELKELATPNAPTITVIGTAGTTSYSYFVVANDKNNNKTLVSAVGSTTTGNATLSSTNYNTISWPAVAGAVSYDVLKGNTGTSIATNLMSTSLNDIGQATLSYIAPTSNTTANLTIDGVLQVNSNSMLNNLTLKGALSGNSTTPTIVLGSAAGTGATSSIVGTNLSGQITLTTGTGVGIGTVITLTLAGAYAFPTNTFVNFTAGNNNFAGVMNTIYCTTTTTTVTLSVTAALALSTTYVGFYSITGN